MLALIIVGLATPVINKQFNIGPKLSRMGGEVAGVLIENTTEKFLGTANIVGAVGTAPYQTIGGEVSIAGAIRMDTGGYIIGEPTYGVRLNNSLNTLNLIVAKNDGTVYMPSGKVGIGITSPGYQLDVKGANDTELISWKNAGGYLLGTLGRATNGAYNSGGLQIKSDGTTTQVYLTGSGNSYINQGKFGIGTATPTDKLNINQNWFDNSTTDWGGGIKMEGNNPTIGFWETDNGAHRWMWHLSSDIMNLYRRPVGGGWERKLYVENNGNVTATSFTGNLNGNATYATTAGSAPASDVPSQSKNLNQWVNTDSAPTFAYLNGTSILTEPYWFHHQGDANLVIRNRYDGFVMWAASYTGTAWKSDIRLKENIKPLGDSLDKLNQLQSVSFDWKEHKPAPYHDNAPLGFIAQELEKIYPELVYEDSLTGMKMIDYGGLTAPIIKSIQELDNKISYLWNMITSASERIDALTKQVNSQQNEINALKAEIENLKK